MMMLEIGQISLTFIKYKRMYAFECVLTAIQFEIDNRYDPGDLYKIAKNNKLNETLNKPSVVGQIEEMSCM